MKIYKRKDGTTVYKKGKFKVFEISKRPHGGYCCRIFFEGKIIGQEGYYAKSLPTKLSALKYGKKVYNIYKN